MPYFTCASPYNWSQARWTRGRRSNRLGPLVSLLVTRSSYLQRFPTGNWLLPVLWCPMSPLEGSGKVLREGVSLLSAFLHKLLGCSTPQHPSKELKLYLRQQEVPGQQPGVCNNKGKMCFPSCRALPGALLPSRELLTNTAPLPG